VVKALADGGAPECRNLSGEGGETFRISRCGSLFSRTKCSVRWASQQRGGFLPGRHQDSGLRERRHAECGVGGALAPGCRHTVGMRRSEGGEVRGRRRAGQRGRRRSARLGPGRGAGGHAEAGQGAASTSRGASRRWPVASAQAARCAGPAAWRASSFAVACLARELLVGRRTSAPKSLPWSRMSSQRTGDWRARPSLRKTSTGYL
jgi:hypothetical protein